MTAQAAVVAMVAMVVVEATAAPLPGMEGEEETLGVEVEVEGLEVAHLRGTVTGRARVATPVSLEARTSATNAAPPSQAAMVEVGTGVEELLEVIQAGVVGVAVADRHPVKEIGRAHRAAPMSLAPSPSASSAERPDLIDVASQVERLVASPQAPPVLSCYPPLIRSPSLLLGVSSVTLVKRHGLKRQRWLVPPCLSLSEMKPCCNKWSAQDWEASTAPLSNTGAWMASLPSIPTAHWFLTVESTALSL